MQHLSRIPLLMMRSTTNPTSIHPGQPQSQFATTTTTTTPQADVQLIKRLIKEAKNSGFDSGSTKSQGSPR